MDDLRRKLVAELLLEQKITGKQVINAIQPRAWLRNLKLMTRKFLEKASVGGSISVSLADLAEAVIQDQIICFDDIERSSPECIRELLGFTNYLVEVKNCKVLVIYGSGEVDVAIKNEIARFREKVFADWVSLDVNRTEVYERVWSNAIGQSSSQYSVATLTQSKEDVMQLWELSASQNIRDLLRLFDKMNALAEYHQKTLPDIVVQYATIVTLEAKEFGWERLDIFNFNPMIVHHATSDSSQKRELSRETLFQSGLLKKYAKAYGIFFQQPPGLLEYLRDGALDSIELSAIIDPPVTESGPLQDILAIATSDRFVLQTDSERRAVNETILTELPRNSALSAKGIMALASCIFYNCKIAKLDIPINFHNVVGEALLRRAERQDISYLITFGEEKKFLDTAGLFDVYQKYRGRLAEVEQGSAQAAVERLILDGADRLNEAIGDIEKGYQALFSDATLQKLETLSPKWNGRYQIMRLMVGIIRNRAGELGEKHDEAKTRLREKLKSRISAVDADNTERHYCQGLLDQV